MLPYFEGAIQLAAQRRRFDKLHWVNCHAGFGMNIELSETLARTN